MSTVKAPDDLRVNDTAEWTKDGGAVFARRMGGHVWVMRVPREGIVSVAQVALLLSVTVQAVHRWVNEGLLPLSGKSAIEGRGFARRSARRVKLSAVRKLATEKGLFLGVAR